LKGRAEANKKKIHLKNIKKIREYDEGWMKSNASIFLTRQKMAAQKR
jgi:hypothetical protein